MDMNRNGYKSQWIAIAMGRNPFSNAAFLLMISFLCHADPSGPEILSNMENAAETAIPYSVKYSDESFAQPLIITIWQQRDSNGNYEARVDHTADMLGTNWETILWRNKFGNWEELGNQILRLDFMPTSEQTPLMAFDYLGLANYRQVEVLREVKFQGIPCFVVKAEFSEEAIQRIKDGRVSKAGKESSPVEQIFTISKGDWLPRGVKSYDQSGNEVQSIGPSDIQTHLTLDQDFFSPPKTNMVVITQASELFKYVHQYNHGFIPATQQILAQHARAGKKVSAVFFLFFLGLSAVICTLLVLKRRKNLGG
jgi:hypothetical protein